MAKLAKMGEINNMAMPLMLPPKKEYNVPIPRALAASPFCAMGYPSNTVATDEGVPGIRMSIAAINPPEMPPTYSATRNAIPCMDGNE